MGNVLIDFNTIDFLNTFNISDDDKKILMNDIFKSVEWAMMDRGSLNEEEMFQIIKTRIPERLFDCAKKLIFDWFALSKPIDGMADYIKQLKERGYNLYLLSNASRRLHTFWDKVAGSEYFDDIVVSADIGMVKPEKELFAYVLDKYKLQANECVFIDDSPWNIESANRNGILGVVFHGNVQELREKLEKMLEN